MSDNVPVPTVELLSKELKDVVDDWKVFGVSLSVPMRKLNAIKLDDPNGGVDNWKLKMFQFWLQYKPDASWNDVVRALKEIDYNDLAATLTRKYLLAADSSEAQVGIEAEIRATAAVVEQLQDLEISFATMLTNLPSLLAVCNCDFSKAQSFLDNVFNTEKFSQCIDFNALIQQLRRDHIDTFNIYYLEQFLVFLQDEIELEEIKMKLVKPVEGYKKREDFLADTKVIEFHDAVVCEVNPAELSQKMKLTIKISDDLASERTLKDIEKLALKAFDECYRSLVHMHAKKGSVIISWFIPDNQSDKFETLAKENATIFKDAGVEEVTVGGRVVFPCTLEEDIPTASLKEINADLLSGIEYLQTLAEKVSAAVLNQGVPIAQDAGKPQQFENTVSIMRKKALSAMMVATGSRDTGVKELEEMKSVSDIHALTATEEGPVSLPAGWKACTTPNGHVFYVDHNTQTTQWQDPRIIEKYQLPSLDLPTLPAYTETSGLFSLDQLCSDSDLIEISQFNNDWKEIAPFLGLTETDEQNIFSSAHNSLPAQRVVMLKMWRERHGPAATYSRLANAFRLCGRQDLVEHVNVLVDRRETRTSTDLFLLDQPCLDSDLIEISQLINDWREIAPFLGLTETDEQNILEYAPNSVPGQRITMLRTWRQRHGPAATYGRLADSFRQYGRQDLVERLSVLVNRKETSSSTAHDVSQTHSNPSISPYTPVHPYFPSPDQQPHLPSPLPYLMPQRPNPFLALQHSYFPPPSTSLYHNQHYNVPSYQTTTANTLTHSSQFSHDHTYDGPPLPQRPRLDTSLAMVDPLATATAYHSSSHVTHSLSTPFSPHVGQSSDTIPSSSGTTSSRPPFLLPPYSFSDFAPPQHSPSYGPPPPKRSRLDTASSSPLATLHPTSTVTEGPHRDFGYKSTSTLSVAPPPPPATTASPFLQRYVTYLKQLYIATKTPVYDKESYFIYYKAKSFINIALVSKDSAKNMTDSDKNEMIMNRLHGHVDAIQKKKTKLNFNNVCKCEDGSVAHSVLVEGAPGVGKTTFVLELCKQWARGEILQEWGVVVIIKLRDQRTRTAQTINDLLYHPDPKLRQAVTELVEQDGEGMLLILDGYDELTTKQRESGSVIQWLMSRELLCRVTLMVTSRPLATRTLHPKFQRSIDQHIEVLGFTDKNIEEYINSACGDNPELVEDFKDYLSSFPFSSSLMFNPQQCAIVTDLYRSHWQCGDKGFAPKTLTELYTGLVHTLLLRYLTPHPVHKDRNWRLRDMSNLPEDVKQQLKAVTALAAKGIENQQYVFDEEDDNVPSETLGLMQREEELTAGIGRSSSHNFLHLTLQEYLAAVNYSQQCELLPEQLTQILGRKGLFPLSNFLKSYGKKIKQSSSSSATHWPAVLFLAGKTQLSGILPNLLKTGLQNSNSSVDVSLLHLLYETQCPQLIQSTLITSGKYISVSGHSALDWFVIGYCIANSTTTWRVEKKANVTRHEYFSQLMKGLKLAPQDGSGQGKIVSLDIRGTLPKNLEILSQLKPYTSKTVTNIKLYCPRNISRNSNGESKVDEVLDCYQLLEELWIENAEVHNSHLISQQNYLPTLTLMDCKLSNEATSSLIHFLQSPNSRLLRKLSFDDCAFSTTDHTYQFSSFELLETDGKFSLNAKGSSFAIIHWLLYLSFYANLMTELILNVSKQDSSTDETLEGIGLDNLHTLSLTECQLSSETTSSLIHSLQSPHCRLNKLSLHDCTIPATDNNFGFTFSELQQGKIYFTATGSCCAINHWLSQLSSYSVLLSELILSITKQETNDALEGISLFSHMLDILNINNNHTTCFSFPVLLFLELRQNNLHTLSLTKCKLNSEATSSLIHSLLSPDYKLNKLSLSECTISTTDHTYQFSTLTLQHTNGRVCLNATGSCSEINHWLSQLSSYTKLKLTESIFKIVEQDSSSDDTLENICLYRDVLEILRFNDSKYFVIPQFIGLQQNNLHTLSLYQCKFSSETTSSLIHSLQSPHCRLHKLALYDCTIPTTDRTLLTTAIVSSTTITYLFFIDKHIDTPSLTALASGLKQNRTMEELAVNNIVYSKRFTKEQFQLLIEGVDSSAVKKLWLRIYYKNLLSVCPLSRDDVVVEWYNYADDMYKKW